MNIDYLINTVGHGDSAGGTGFNFVLAPKYMYLLNLLGERLHYSVFKECIAAILMEFDYFGTRGATSARLVSRGRILGHLNCSSVPVLVTVSPSPPFQPLPLDTRRPLVAQ